MDLDPKTLKTVYYAGSTVFVGLLAWNGWRQGIVRQAMTLVSIVAAYLAAWFGASSAAPVFGFLHYPPLITRLIAGAAVGCATFLALHSVRRLLVRRTAQQTSPTLRLSFGILGACVGLGFGLLFFFVTSSTIRALGEVAKARLDDHEKEAHPSPDAPKAPPLTAEDDPGPLVRGIAKLGGALDEGKSGKFFHRYDAVPAAHVFATLAKLGIMVSRPEAVDRFLSYPGVRELAHHPKLVAVRNDPDVSKLLVEQSYIRLLRHEKVVALSNDEEFNALIRKMDFEKALDHALQSPVKESALPAAPEPPAEPTE